jgi:C-terminal processing protease CtpA/Prc
MARMDRRFFIALIMLLPIVYPDGTSIEGKGVEPDLVVGLNASGLLRGVDAQLEAAIRHLEQPGSE